VCEEITRIKRRFGFKGKNQLPLFMIWDEIWVNNELIHAVVIFNSRDWIRI
jgi:hypothetical protein